MQRQDAERLVVFYVTCPTCGDMELRASALHLTVFSHGKNSFYAFFCPGCTEEIRRHCTIDEMIALCGAQVACTEVHVPDEVLDPVRSGPPLSPDDVMDFVVAFRALDDTLWLS